ncbi:uncharacterized protein LOC128964610 [Oppia nitens]|uniref:uncharacterized protein LOC128964610 n=1 Tax=Oppia nitens TaxID=1686743 RepID=UPI0023DC928E|nr:uncharacterized protein LOC128964610 [Oppia nitens]
MSRHESIGGADNRRNKCLSFSLDSLGLIYRCLDTIILLVVLSYQNYSLSYCLTLHNKDNNLWFFYFLVDFIVIFLFIYGSIVAIRYYRKYHVFKRSNIGDSSAEQTRLEVIDNNVKSVSQNNKHFNIRFPKVLGKLPLLWICWILYTVLISTKIFILHLQNIAPNLYMKSINKEKNVEDFHPFTIHISLAAMTVVFFCWIEIHRNYRSNKSKECIKELTTLAVFEIFDSIDLLDLLLPDSKEFNLDNQWISSFVVLLATINLLLPTIGLFQLSKSGMYSHSVSLRIDILHNFLRMLFVNIPYMILRIIFWISIKKEISIFLLKNALFVFIGIRHIISEIHELKTTQNTDKSTIELSLNVVSDNTKSGEQNIKDNQIDE